MFFFLIIPSLSALSFTSLAFKIYSEWPGTIEKTVLRLRYWNLNWSGSRKLYVVCGLQLHAESL